VNVTAIIPTRGDVDLDPILRSLPHWWERIVWDNGAREVVRHTPFATGYEVTTAPLAVPDCSVFGRYAAVPLAMNDLIYVQDDDVVVSDPAAIAEAWAVAAWDGPRFLVANMPPEFRHDGYTDSCLVGFGACFHRHAPDAAFKRFEKWRVDAGEQLDRDLIHRECDAIFTTLTPRTLVNVPKSDREFASDPSRLWKQPGHVHARKTMLEMARRARDWRQP
jgi:hypothetical protein